MMFSKIFSITSHRFITWPIITLFGFVLLACIAYNGKTFAALPGQSPIWKETFTDRLKRDLFMKYDKFARPAQHFNTTVVHFEMGVVGISVDDFKSSMIVDAIVNMTWIDEKLKWNASEYGGLNQLHVSTHELWQPDITLYNSIPGGSIEYYGDTHCNVHPDGLVLWNPPTIFPSLCELDLRLWPFDTQECYLMLSSQSYLGDEIDLKIYDSETNYHPDIQIQYREWRLMKLTSYRSVEKRQDFDFIEANFIFTIKRHSPLYYATVIAPAIAIVFLILVIFWLPPQCSEKITLCGCTALIISIFLIYFGHIVPPLAGKPPLLICFYSGCLYLLTISLIISAFVINLSRRPHCRPLPRGIKRILVGRPGQCLALFDHIHMLESRRPIGEQELRETHPSDGNTYNQSNSLTNCSENGERENIISPAMSTAQLEWILAATAVDRLAFFIFSIIFFIMALACLT